jgi:hypothetical protein
VCALVLLLVLQFVVLYLFLYLFQLVTYRGVPGMVPWLLLGGFTVLLVGLAAGALRRGGPSGLLVGTGLLLVAAAPFAAFGGGCEVAGGAGLLGSLPHLVWRGVGVGIETANGACDAYLNALLLGVGYAFLAAGAWLDPATDATIDRLMTALERFWLTASA